MFRRQDDLALGWGGVFFHCTKIRFLIGYFKDIFNNLPGKVLFCSVSKKLTIIMLKCHIWMALLKWYV